MKQLISIGLFFIAFSSGLLAQELKLDTLVNLQLDGITLKETLNEISAQYGIKFSYSDSKIPVDRIIYTNYSSAWLYDVLRDLFHQNEISYSIIENQIVLFPFNPDQAIKIHGKVIDNMNRSPIPFANISLSGTSKGTSSNEDGEFEISLPKLPAELIFSHISYEKKLVYVYDDSKELTIELMPAPRQLSEITINARRNKNAYYNLVKKAYERIGNTANEIKYGKAFYRQKSQRENKYTEIFEIFYDVKYSTNGIEDWAVQEGRYAFQNTNEYDIFLYNKNFTLLSRMFPIRQPETNSYIIPINPNVKKLFDLDLKEIIKNDDRLIGVLSFKPKPEVTQPAASGEIYIDFDNYQVLKMNGTITNDKLGIIGFGDDKSNWKNYKLDFQISFIDNPSDQLLMDYIQIDHSFDYYFNDEFIGKINTSSLLTFYEHYTPVRSKKLGGTINYKTSDVEVIDGLGYNPAFWSQNPIVKRTPLEDKLISDFEKNEAFGVVFMNNEEEVVLLPDKIDSKNARAVISRFESEHANESPYKLFLRLDRNNYTPEDNLQFTAYLIDSWTFKPMILGSELYLELVDDSGDKILEKKYDISNGTAYGELDFSSITVAGKYRLKAFTNIHEGEIYERVLSISYENHVSSPSAHIADNPSDTNWTLEFYPAGGDLLQGTQTPVVFTAKNSKDLPVKSNWYLMDNLGNIILSTSSNNLGIGSFEFTPLKDVQYFIRPSELYADRKWSLPEAVNYGFNMNIDHDIMRSVHVELNQRPGLPKEIYLLFTAGGKVFSFYEKQLSGTKAIIDLPVQHLPGGINTLFALDQTGNILAKRSFYIPPEKLNIHMESAAWKSKKSNRMQLTFQVQDQTGKPVQANLSAVCSPSDPSDCNKCDIRNSLYFGKLDGLDEINLSTDSDSIYELIDHLLIVDDAKDNTAKPSVKSQTVNIQPLPQIGLNEKIDEQVFAEVSVSGNFTRQTAKESGQTNRQKFYLQNKNESYWIPSLPVDDHGMATIDYKINNKNQGFYVSIQGISPNGLVGYLNLLIDPNGIKNIQK